MSTDPDAAKKNLIEGISADAEEQAAKIIEEAENAAMERKAAADAQISRITADAEKALREKILRIERDADIRRETALRKISLETREKTYRKIADLAERRFQDSVGRPEYLEIIRGWIVEAALGLSSTELEVNCSAAERKAVTSVLADAQQEIDERGGGKVNIAVSQDPPLAAFGVVVVSKDGRMAFNNQIHNRIDRYQSEIRKLIFNRLFQDSV